MKKIIMALMAACLAAPVMAEPLKDEDYFTMHSMGRLEDLLLPKYIR